MRLWDGVSDGYSPFDSIVVEGESIVAMGRGLPGEDCTGLTVLPGLIDAHVHMVLDPSIASLADQLMQSESDIRDKMVRRAEAMVRHGITTARDLGGGNWLELELRDRIDAGEIIGPRLKCAGQPVTSVKGHCHFWGGEATDADAAAAVIQRQHEHGVDLIKVMATGGMQTPNSEPKDSQFDQPTLSAIVAAANARGYAVAAHCHGTPGIRHAAHAGVRSIEHCSWIGADGKREPYDPTVAREIAQRGIWVSPTVNAGWGRFPEAFTSASGRTSRPQSPGLPPRGLHRRGDSQRPPRGPCAGAAGVRTPGGTDAAGGPEVRHQRVRRRPRARRCHGHLARGAGCRFTIRPRRPPGGLERPAAACDGGRAWQSVCTAGSEPG